MVRFWFSKFAPRACASRSLPYAIEEGFHLFVRGKIVVIQTPLDLGNLLCREFDVVLSMFEEIEQQNRSGLLPFLGQRRAEGR